MTFPRLYAIVDADLLSSHSLDLASFVTELRDAGVNLIQYRNKSGNARAILHDAARLKNLRTGNNLKLIMNDRTDLALLSGFDGVHVGQQDLAPEDARRIIGPNAWVGVSTHSPQQVAEADQTPCDYIAYGPIFPTATKENPDPVVGLNGLRMARTLTQKPLVAIGGITLGNCRSAPNSGADSVAIISALLPTGSGLGSKSTRQIAGEFLALLN